MIRNALRLCSALAVVAAAQSLSPIAHAGPVANAVPAEVFAATPGFQGARLSPDGKRVAVKMALTGKQVLVITSLEGSSPPRMMDAGELDIDDWQWVNNDWLILGLGNTENYSGIDFYVTRAAAISADLASFRKIDWENSGQFADDVIWVAQDGSPRIILSKETGLFHDEDVYPSVYSVDVSTGKSKRVLSSVQGVGQWLADSSGTVRMGVYSASPTAGRAYYYREAGGQFSATPAVDAKGYDRPIPRVFLPSGKTLGWVNANGFDALGEIDLPSFRPKTNVFQATGYDVDSLVVTPDRSEVLGATYTSTGDRVEWFDPGMREVQKELDERAGVGNAHVVSYNKDRTRFIVEMSEPSQAGAYYLWDKSVGIPTFLAWVNPVLKDRRMNPVSTVQYKARDGVPINAVMTLPRGQEAKNLPLIVMPHGGPGARDSETFDWWAQYLAEQGYAVIQPNYRGSTGYGNYFYRLGEGQMGLKMQDDLLDAIDWASTTGVADSKRVCIVGGSYGGYAAMRAAQRDGSRYRCAVSYAGVSDLNEMMKYDKAFFIGSNPKRYWRTLAPDFTEVSPRNHPADFSIPILIMHGAKDKRVPVKQSRAMVAKLQRAGKPVVYVEQPQGDHHFTREADRLGFLNEIKSFLDKYNPAG